MSEQRWPSATLDPIRRARILADAIPGGFVETVFDVPFEHVWAWLSNLEHSVPAFDRQVDALRITSRRPSPDGRGEDLRLIATNHHIPLPFSARLEPGLCVMQTRVRGFVVVMAAVAEGPDRTRYAHLEAVPLPGGRLLSRRLGQEVRHDVKGIGARLTGA